MANRERKPRLSSSQIINGYLTVVVQFQAVEMIPSESNKDKSKTIETVPYLFFAKETDCRLLL
jgi:hypothetical protein